MNNKGFTLIELLSVIVILAIIALIATPIILSIIEDAREEANKRSIELYASAVKNAIATYQLKEEDDPTSFLDIEKYIEYDGNVICDTVQINGDGTVGLANCKVNGEKVNYKYGNLSTCIIERQNSNKYTIGDIVTCTLTESIDKFYVIENKSIDTKTIELLPEKNIHVTEYRQSDNAGETLAIVPVLDEYGNEVYDENGSAIYNDLLIPIINEYVFYLNQSNLGASGKGISTSKLNNLGCYTSSHMSMTYFCQGSAGYEDDVEGEAPSWLYSPAYWTGEFAFNDCYWHVSGMVTEGYSPSGVRPVITINTSEIG